MSDAEDPEEPEIDRAPPDSEMETLFQGPPGAAPRPSSSTPEWIGAYRVERRLGHGGMGEIFLAWDDRLKRQVAIKRIRHGTEHPDSWQARFRREAQAPACLSHPAIVQVYDLVTDDQGDAIVMEYVKGVTLAQRLSQGALSPAEAVRLARQIAEGLAAAHEAGLVHRDLKAENVIVTPGGQAKILDFGLVCPVTRTESDVLTKEGVLLGTFHAMSPEQAGGEEIDERSDLFSLGALLYEMISGHAPFRGANTLDTLKKVITFHPPPLFEANHDLPERLSALVQQLLAKKPEERPASAKKVAETLSAIEPWLPEPTASVSELPTVAVRTPSNPPPVPRRRLWPWLAGVAGLIALTVLIVTIRSQPKTRQPDSPEDARYQEIKRQFENGDAVQGPQLSTLERIASNSPDACILGAKVAVRLYDSKEDPNYLERATVLVKRAKSLARDDLRWLSPMHEIKIRRKDFGIAKKILDQMEDRLPMDDPDLLLLRAQWALRGGRNGDALKDLKRLVDVSDTWKSYFWQAKAELDTGDIQKARDDCRAALKKSPGNLQVRELQAFIELEHGNTLEAEEMFRSLTQDEKDRFYPFFLLGFARFLNGSYRPAAEAFEGALALAPNHKEILTWLGDAEFELTDTKEARRRYKQALDSLSDPGGILSPEDKMLKAHCLARLGDNEKAAELAQNTLKESPPDPELLFDAAFVDSVVGNRERALAEAQDALRKGKEPRWLAGAAFQDPEIQALITSGRMQLPLGAPPEAGASTSASAQAPAPSSAPSPH